MRLDPFRVIGQLVIEHLHRPIGFTGRREDGDAVVQFTLCLRPFLAMNDCFGETPGAERCTTGAPSAAVAASIGTGPVGSIISSKRTWTI